MIWSRAIEDTIYSIYHRYDIQGNKKVMERLKAICMNELNQHPSIKDEIIRTGKENNNTYKIIEYFVIQMALENVK